MFAQCDPGETAIEFSHVTNTDTHPKGLAASLIEERVNKEMNGKACMQVYPNSSLYNDDKVPEALLDGHVQLAAPSLSKFEEHTEKFPSSTCPSCSRTWPPWTVSRTPPTAASSRTRWRGSVQTSYRALGIARKTFYDKLAKHGLDREDYQ